ncbi:MAG: L-sulfolactate dehydrogenase [Methanosphaera sp.]|uniref:L-sulfolactate dehydrogenase n=1 Tax=Methanosphaera sp. TaxID=2666342 RepID=UPI0025EDFE3B|nr:L-sulfolactate dehydrogenase [Methanosphaera sp.]MCI5867025.1 L-sulfolactate dehydrogenase [Methanosphaera sp.]MDD6533968.1 L-sulfolactate dehydrogenase [Methanosphaera sp.]MDY3956222.1 L-sulfolactate dehydrogenase [Methanosphaera sp.]
MKISIDNETKLIETMLEAYGVESKEAKIVAEVVVDGDLKGFSTHGLGRFPQYIKSIKAGTIKTDGDYEIEKESASSAMINGNHKFGHYVTVKAMDLAVKKASETGVGIVGIHDSNHYGIAGYYADLASIQDMIGIVISNTEPAMAAFGGKKALLGTNPITISIPSDDIDNYICLDMATSITARGKLLESKRKGEPIPEGMALDKDGNPTTDPAEGLEGSILPFGGFKGYGLAFMFELLAGPLVSAACGEKVEGTATPDVMCTKGDLLIVINPEFFGGSMQFKFYVDQFVREIREENGVIPGDREVQNISTNYENGIEVDEALYEQLTEMAQEKGLDITSYFDE